MFIFLPPVKCTADNSHVYETTLSYSIPALSRAARLFSLKLPQQNSASRRVISVSQGFCERTKHATVVCRRLLAQTQLRKTMTHKSQGALKVVSVIQGRNINDHIHLIFPPDRLAALHRSRPSKKHVSVGSLCSGIAHKNKVGTANHSKPK